MEFSSRCLSSSIQCGN